MEPLVYYNEIDPFCVSWLWSLIGEGHIASGVVDSRPIEDVPPEDLEGFTQCHFFAGIGGWSYALRLAGWPDDRPVWTGSCPCQPFSAAGKGAGFADERHLWPYWFYLIEQCRPPTIFGEQVASKAVDAWIDLVHADLEGMGYAFGGVAFPAAGVGAPHIRDRTYWVGDANVSVAEQLARQRARPAEAESARAFGQLDRPGASLRLADADGGNTSAERQQRSGEQRQQPQDGGAGGVADAEHDGHHRPNRATALADRHESDGRLLDGDCAAGSERPGPTNGYWRAADWLGCTDGKWRPVEPGTFPLAHGVPNRVGRLRGYGNCIVPQVAAEFIKSYMDLERG